jgi:hypothetical protein
MGTALRILVACLVVGLLLSFFAVDPRSLLTGGWEAAVEAGRLALEAAAWAVPYVLLGATVVVPVAVLVALLRLFGRRRRGP